MARLSQKGRSRHEVASEVFRSAEAPHQRGKWPSRQQTAEVGKPSVSQRIRALVLFTE